jgi:hypothetical protein
MRRLKNRAKETAEGQKEGEAARNLAAVSRATAIEGDRSPSLPASRAAQNRTKNWRFGGSGTSTSSSQEANERRSSWNGKERRAAEPNEGQKTDSGFNAGQSTAETTMAEKDEIRIERSGLPCSRPGWALNSGVNRTVCSPSALLISYCVAGLPSSFCPGEQVESTG